MKKEIDIKNKGSYIVEDGKIIFVGPYESGYGQQVLHWENGKLSHTQTTITKKFN
ncbi:MULTISPECIES: DUF3954 domain-containing protein [Bacillus cereus group]|uniref:DUF3954 domain-containing protein n=1 Tax=Bacillus cereus group TaxID=86661 RepID=UPI00124CB97D|nr:DUF3954 domain-containing protein [Bacillus cereus]KAB2419667.1 DUF3954 domain-containing protein [Bacillus cereus]